MLPTLTVDIGTTSVKLSVFDDAGALLASSSQATPTASDGIGEIYDLDALLGMLRAFSRELDPALRGSVRRIALTGVGESGGLVRDDLTLASPMILWHDHRGAALLESLDADARTLVYRTTGLPVNANYGLSKVAWALANAEDAIGAQWLNIAEYLAALLTGERWSEYSLASRTMALDLSTRQWSPEVCALLGVDVAVFPPLRRASEGSAARSSFARELGFSSEVRVHVAGHDHMVGGVGADLRHGELLNSTGTTEGLLFVTATPTVDEHAERSKLANGIACTGDDVTLFASIPTGGSAFATLQGMLGLDPERLTAVVDGLAERYTAGRIDLDSIPLVLPQFRGSPPPTKNAAARGLIAGLSSETTLDDIVFGTFLGMALQFAEVLALFRLSPSRVKVIGPASRNPLWLQLKADLLGVPLSVSRFPEVVSRGAQALASGEASDWASSEPFEVQPDPERSDRLAVWRESVRPLWGHLRNAPA